MSHKANKRYLSVPMGMVVILLLLLLPPSQALGKARDWRTYSVKVDSGYLALRTEPSYDERNEIGKFYTGDVVTVIDTKSNKKYWKVSSFKYNRNGWVNKNYLEFLDNDPDGTYTVSVAKGYLALRTRPAYDDANEIGSLYTGDEVTLLDKYNKTYWWVYSPKFHAYGYVNKNYLKSAGSSSSYGTYGVKVDKGYLALRTRPAYDESNEIGSLYTGDRVTVIDKPGGQYWWVYSPKHDKSGYVNKAYLYKL